MSRLVLQPRDYRLLTDLFLHRVMSRDQIIGLGYFRSVPRANYRLGQLLQNGFLKRYLFTAHGTGSQSLCGVAKDAEHVLAQELDLTLDEIQPVTRRLVPPLFLDHTLGLVDLRARLYGLAKMARLEQFEWAAEPVCRHEYSAGRERRIVKPDARIQWLSGNSIQYCFVELDRGFVSRAKFAAKIESYRTYLADGGFASVYGSASFSVLIVVPSKARKQTIIKLIGSQVRGPYFLTRTADELSERDLLGGLQ